MSAPAPFETTTNLRYPPDEHAHRQLHLMIMLIKSQATIVAMSNLAKNLARTLRQLRGDQTQRVFARRLGLDQATLNRMEQSRENITLRTIQKMCDHLRCTAGRLLDAEEKIDKSTGRKATGSIKREDAG